MKFIERQFRVFTLMNQALSSSSRQKQKKSTGLAALIRAFFSAFNAEIGLRVPIHKRENPKLTFIEVASDG